MGLKDLTQIQARARLAAVIWAVAGAGFFVTFFAGGGAEDFATASGRHLAGAVALAFGFGGWWTALWVTRQRAGSQLLADERDAQVVAGAGQATLVIVLLAIYALTMGLWIAYEPAGQIPVGWMWFLAYGSVILASLTHALATMVLDRRTGGHG